MAEQTTEQKFQAFKKSVKREEFDNVSFLNDKAQALMEEDEALAKRILVRVKNLNKKAVSPSAKPISGTDKPTSANQDATVKNPAEQKAKIAAAKLAQAPIKEEQPQNLMQKLRDLSAGRLFMLMVVVPSLMFAFYQNIWATERFDSQAQVIVQQPDGMATMDASMAILSGLGVSNSGISDNELVKAYIYSNDMLAYLNDTIGLREHYSQEHIDYFSRLHASDTQEDFIAFYQKHVAVYIDSKSSVIHINAQGFDPAYAKRLSQTIVERAEWYMNSIGHQLAEAQLEFIKGEHQLVEDTLEEAQRALLQFQQRYNLLDPTAEGMAMQQIAYTLEGQISVKEAELKGAQGIMSVNAPQVINLENELRALRQQLENERNKLSQDSDQTIPVSEILARFTDLKIKMELALKAYTSSQVSLEKSRIEAYRQLKYLVVVESATLPESSQYPAAFYNVSLFTIVLSLLFAIGRVFVLVVKELS
ncbi:lipopolysaccharide biosynthesis protein [Vibrio astriarenae]|uniref:lipopolysaccharide biosynthesis protein n=1 Tax=Vibrio astriarenae TaxID=1481923 RepID=UPI0037359968